MTKKNNNSAIDVNDTLSKSEAFFFRYKKPIIILVVAIIVIVGGFALYKNLIEAPREEKASTELAKGQDLFGMQQYEKALNGDGATFSGLVKIASDYSSTNAGNLAKLYAGLCYANLNKWNEAVKYLDEFSPKSDAMVSPAALAALGNAYAHVGKIDDAIKTLKKAAEKADKQADDNTNNSLSPTFLLQAGQLLESQNNKAEALKTYKEIKEKYVNSALVQSQEIDKYIERASL